MARELARGEIWMYRFASPDRRRPVLILTRPVLLRVLETATVAAVTSTVRGSPTEVILGVEDGLKAVSCVNLVNVFTVRQADLRKYVGMVSSEKMRAVCRALAIACCCEDATVQS
jgi:mRNA interferase MazF